MGRVLGALDDRKGELQIVLEDGLQQPFVGRELEAEGRAGDDEITLFDGTGVGLQDLAVAAAVVDLAIAKGVAIEVDF